MTKSNHEKGYYTTLKNTAASDSSPVAFKQLNIARGKVLGESDIALAPYECNWGRIGSYFNEWRHVVNLKL